MHIVTCDDHRHADAGRTLAAAASARAGRAAGAGATSGESRGHYAYYVDTLMRASQPATTTGTATAAAGADANSTRDEAGRIFANGMRRENLAPADKTYLASLIAAKTGVSQAEAEQRVDQTMAQAKNAEAEAKQAADTARKAAAHLSLWTFLSFLIGAFCASYAATIGGRQRDRSIA